MCAALCFSRWKKTNGKLYKCTVSLWRIIAIIVGKLHGSYCGSTFDRLIKYTQCRNRQNNWKKLIWIWVHIKISLSACRDFKKKSFFSGFDIVQYGTRLSLNTGIRYHMLSRRYLFNSITECGAVSWQKKLSTDRHRNIWNFCFR